MPISLGIGIGLSFEDDLDIIVGLLLLLMEGGQLLMPVNSVNTAIIFP